MKLFCSHYNFIKQEKKSNQRQFSCFSFVSLLILFLFLCLCLLWESILNGKHHQRQHNQRHNQWIFPIYFLENRMKIREEFSKKMISNKIQYVIEMEIVMNDNKWWKMCFCCCWFLMTCCFVKLLQENFFWFCWCKIWET